MRLTRTRRIAALTAALLPAGVGIAAGGTDDVGSLGSISVGDITAKNGGCTKAPVSYDFTAGVPLDGTWRLDLSGGAVSVFLHGDGYDALGEDEVQWCPSDGIGTTTLTGSLEVMDADYEDVAIEPAWLCQRMSRAIVRGRGEAGGPDSRAVAPATGSGPSPARDVTDPCRAGAPRRSARSRCVRMRA